MKDLPDSVNHSRKLLVNHSRKLLVLVNKGDLPDSVNHSRKLLVPSATTEE